MRGRDRILDQPVVDSRDAVDTWIPAEDRDSVHQAHDQGRDSGSETDGQQVPDVIIGSQVDCCGKFVGLVQAHGVAQHDSLGCPAGA